MKFSRLFFFFLAALGLSCSMGIFNCSMPTLSWGMWELVPWPGIEPRSPALGAWSLGDCTNREVPQKWNSKISFSAECKVQVNIWYYFKWQKRDNHQNLNRMLSIAIMKSTLPQKSNIKNRVNHKFPCGLLTHFVSLMPLFLLVVFLSFHTRTCMLSHVWLFATPWTVAHQVPLSMGFSRQEYWSGLPLPPEDLPDPGIEPVSLSGSCNGRQILITWGTWVSL